MILFLGGLCVGLSLGVVVALMIRDEDDIGRGHPL